MIFRGRSGPPAPPLDPHLGLSMVLSIHAENAPNLTNRYLGMFLEGQVDRQTDRQTGRRGHRRPTPKQYPSDFIGGGGGPVMSTSYLVSYSRTQRSASGEARTRNPSISGQALYHDCAPQLGSILCRYDTCPTQYAPDLRGAYCVCRVHNMHLERAYCVWSILWLYNAHQPLKLSKLVSPRVPCCALTFFLSMLTTLLMRPKFDKAIC